MTFPDPIAEIEKRADAMQADHERRKHSVLPMLAWGPIQGYEAHKDRAYLLQALAASQARMKELEVWAGLARRCAHCGKRAATEATIRAAKKVTP